MMWWWTTLALAVPPEIEAMATTVVPDAGDNEVTLAVRWVVLLTSLGFLPGLVLLMTPFTRFVIVFSLLRQALGLQQSPPNQVLVGLALVMSAAVMQPTLQEVNTDAYAPYMAGEIDTTEAAGRAMVPLRRFMLEHTQRPELETAIQIARIQERPRTLDDLPSTVVVTGYVLSELKSAFVAGIKVYAPFLVVDLAVASILLGMGMMMLPPVVISLPFKQMLFVLMDGWHLLVLGLTGAGS